MPREQASELRPKALKSMLRGNFDEAQGFLKKGYRDEMLVGGSLFASFNCVVDLFICYDLQGAQDKSLLAEIEELTTKYVEEGRLETRIWFLQALLAYYKKNIPECRSKLVKILVSEDKDETVEFLATVFLARLESKGLSQDTDGLDRLKRLARNRFLQYYLENKPKELELYWVGMYFIVQYELLLKNKKPSQAGLFEEQFNDYFSEKEAKLFSGIQTEMEIKGNPKLQ